MNLNDYKVYANYARQCLDTNNEAAFVSYRIALHLAPDQEKEQLQQQYEHFIATTCINENVLGQTCTDLILERINNGEYKETLAILTGLLFDNNPYLRHIFCVKYNMLLYILIEASLCEMNRGIKEEHNSMNHYDSLEDFYTTYEKMKFMIRRIWFHIDHEDNLAHLNTILTQKKISIDLLATMIKYTVARPYYKVVFDDIYNYLLQYHVINASLFRRYASWVCNIIPQKAVFTFTEHPIVSPDLEPVYINANNPKHNEGIANPEMISIILCANQQSYVDELMRYIKQLLLPEHFSIELIVVNQASSMAQGYNAGMHAAHGKYKLYIHQDTFLIDPDILIHIIAAFHNDRSTGVIGIAGTTELTDDGIWWNSEAICHRSCIIQDDFLDIMCKIQNNSHKLGTIENVAALDGIFLATSFDIEWRSDLFDGWHFYDISQCREFINAGANVTYYNSNFPVAIHELSLNQYIDPNYEKYRKIFCKNYLKPNK